MTWMQQPWMTPKLYCRSTHACPRIPPSGEICVHSLGASRGLGSVLRMLWKRRRTRYASDSGAHVPQEGGKYTGRVRYGGRFVSRRRTRRGLIPILLSSALFLSVAFAMLSRYILPEVMSPAGRKMYQKNAMSDMRAWDHQVSSILYKGLGRKIPRQYLLALEFTGSGIIIPLVFLLWAMPLSFITPYVRAFSLNLFLGFFTDLALVGTLKGIVRRPRPSYNDSGDFLLVVNVDRFSFPSGHAARAVFIAVLWGSWQLGGWWVSSLVWWWALATAMSRVLMGRHYFLDVFAGLLVGVLNGFLITKGTFSPELSWLPVSSSQRLFNRFISSSSHFG